MRTLCKQRSRLDLALALVLAGCSRPPVTETTGPQASHTRAAASQPSAPATAVAPPKVKASGTAAKQPSLRDKVFEITQASETYDFRVSIDADCDGSESLPGECPRRGSISVLKKGTAEVADTMQQSEIWIQFDDDGQLLVNSAGMYDFQGTINVGDFNFDGHEDFAVQANQSGSYGGPTFEVYLYRPSTRRFVRSKALSELTVSNLGFFRVESAKQSIIAFSKSGCCYHEQQTFKMVGEQPVLVERVMEDATGDQLVETEERLVNGKWVRKTTKKPLPKD